MSEEHFDDKIRQKLNQVQPTYPPNAWERFQVLLPIPWYQALWRSMGVAQVALILSLGSLFFSAWQSHRLSEENQLLRGQLQHVVTRIDTVYQIQRDTLYLVQNVLAPAEMQMPYRRSSSHIPIKEISPQATDPSPTSPDSTQVLSPEWNQASIHLAKEQEETEAEPRVNEEEEAKEMPAETPISPQKKIEWPKIHARVGLASDYVGLKFPTVGPQIEVFLARHISLQSGVLFSGQQTITHARPMDFNLKTGMDFEEKYRDQIKNMATRRIQNIAITSSFIQIPILIKYHIPTPTAWSFQFMAGTKLDYRVFQEVSFLDGVLGDIQRRRFETLQKPKSFHTLTYGMGVQYQKGRLVGQFTPYFDFPFRSNINGPAVPRRLGLQAVLLWDLYPNKQRRLEAWD